MKKRVQLAASITTSFLVIILALFVFMQSNNIVNTIYSKNIQILASEQISNLTIKTTVSYVQDIDANIFELIPEKEVLTDAVLVEDISVTDFVKDENTDNKGKNFIVSKLDKDLQAYNHTINETDSTWEVQIDLGGQLLNRKIDTITRDYLKEIEISDFPFTNVTYEYEGSYKITLNFSKNDYKLESAIEELPGTLLIDFNFGGEQIKNIADSFDAEDLSGKIKIQNIKENTKIQNLEGNYDLSKTGVFLENLFRL